MQQFERVKDIPSSFFLSHNQTLAKVLKIIKKNKKIVNRVLSPVVNLEEWM
jgi:hypothetical protein